MKNLKLLVLATCALVFSTPLGFRTANAKSAAAEPVAPVIPDSLQHLMKGAGVEQGDVLWRIRAGLSAEQAVEVALNEKREREGGNLGKAIPADEVLDTMGTPELQALAQSNGIDLDGATKHSDIVDALSKGRKKVKTETPAAPSEPGDLESMTVADLKDLAAKRNIEITTDMKKADIIAALEAA